MPLMLELATTSCPTCTPEAAHDGSDDDSVSGSASFCTRLSAPTRSRGGRSGAAYQRGGKRVRAASTDGRRAAAAIPFQDRWLLHLGAGCATGEWHLLRLDRTRPADRSTDLTPLPPGFRVSTVDALEAVPGVVLVRVEGRRGSVDYFLVDVETGRTTSSLPSGEHGGRVARSEPLLEERTWVVRTSAARTHDTTV